MMDRWIHNKDLERLIVAGAVEFKSIAKGMFVTDAMLKSAQVSLVLATTLCPGKYLTIVEGGTSLSRKQSILLTG